jgi:hypothetical protein
LKTGLFPQPPLSLPAYAAPADPVGNAGEGGVSEGGEQAGEGGSEPRKRVGGGFVPELFNFLNKIENLQLINVICKGAKRAKDTKFFKIYRKVKILILQNRIYT